MRKLWSSALVLLMAGCATAHPPSSGPTLRIFLARHGQTDWNLARRLQGQTDTELNDTGRKQALELAERVKGVTFDRIYSSALKRSRDTAIIAAMGRPVESLTSFNEQGIGKFEGMYVDGRDPALEAEFNRRSKLETDSLDGGESKQQLFARVCPAVAAIRQRLPSGAVLIVGHGEMNSTILRCLLDLTAEQTEAIHQSNDELYLIEVSPSAAPRLFKLIPKDKLGEL